MLSGAGPLIKHLLFPEAENGVYKETIDKMLVELKENTRNMSMINAQIESSKKTAGIKE